MLSSLSTTTITVLEYEKGTIGSEQDSSPEMSYNELSLR